MEIESPGNPYCQRDLMMIMISLDILILLLDLDQWVFDILPSNKDVTIVISKGELARGNGRDE